MRIILIAIAAVMIAMPAKANPVNQGGHFIIYGAEQVAHFGVGTGGFLAHAGWEIATAPLWLITPRYVAPAPTVVVVKRKQRR